MYVQCLKDRNVVYLYLSFKRYFIGKILEYRILSRKLNILDEHPNY